MPHRFALALLAASIAISGCASRDKPSPPVYTGKEMVVTEYEADLREHHSSWGHTGRGGAALRKPTYQHVLGSPDSLETPAGKLHPELQKSAPAIGGAIAVPDSTIAANCNRQAPQQQPQLAATSYPQPRQSSDFYSVRANSKGSVSEYMRVRDKLCQGAIRLTYEEWQILVEGTPKDVPFELQPKTYLNYPYTPSAK